jgi:hypothetical protein
MRRFHWNSLLASVVVGPLLLSARHSAAQLPAVGPGVQIPALPGQVGVTFTVGQPVQPAASAFTPGETVYVSVDSLPLFSGDQLLTDRFRRGEALKIAEIQRNSGSLFAVEVEFGQGDARRFGYVSRLGLSRQKPDARSPDKEPAKDPPQAAPAANPPADDPAQDVKRIEGQWAVAGITVMGRVNPGAGDPVQVNEIVGLVPGGLNQRNQQGALPIGMLIPMYEYFQFRAGKLLAWNTLPAGNNPGAAVGQQPPATAEMPFRLDVKKNPRRLDVARYLVDNRFRPTAAGIYSWQDDVLVWAFPTALGGLEGIPTPQLGNAEASRPRGFQPDQLKRATVIYLMRVNPADVVVPQAPVGTPARNRGGNVF